jgi:Rrf2 family protein
MWISKRTDYATRAVLALALAGNDRPVTLEELGAQTEVPTTVLSQVMPILRTAGLVRAQRGQRGGYTLNHDPSEITLEHVVRLFEGQLAPIDCATRTNPYPCPMTIGCSLRHVWEQVRDDTISTLSSKTFADLASTAGGRWASIQGPTRTPATA